MGCKYCDGCKKDIQVSFCPKCKSRNVGYVFGFGNLFGVVPKMRCKDCGFEMASFPILSISEEKLHKAVDKMKKKAVKKTNRRKKK
ncbi:hypothetical protein K8R30_01835 [archaeon]|nr:hypothetical protein [archaeon]